ncbi:SGNH/GDSL hydrolase family protein [Actinomycetospora lutea]|uniref:SGNH/GDSL hydrolase family protein n=1 Tax=Actinomycetospora lutea TaxID=663604 RepID=UPI002367182D|nr:SGNH/GDSL hydrolase family protein [Actinomycetospora lutea]MDD7940565.1 SGNH/GDSL hydrolase family protein [Actinomycetospora lutea]
MIDPAGGGRYVALGSSFAAGPGIPPQVDRGVLRSGRNYPSLLAEEIGLPLVDVSCSGATTAHLRHDRQPTLAGPVPPQVEAVTADTALVTVTAGGNDVGYLGMLVSAGLRGTLTARLPWLPAPVRRRLGYTVAVPPPEAFAEVRAALTALVDDVRRRAPGARVVLVDYLTVLGRHATPDTVPLSAAQIGEGRRVAAGLVASFAAAATDAGADLVVASAASGDHGVGAPDPWVSGLAMGFPGLGGPRPFHPTAAGMAAVAAPVAKRLSADPRA